MMKYLLDTHVVLWIAENSPMLSNDAKSVITDPNSENYVSLVSVWEVAIKLKSGKLRFEGGLQGFMQMIEKKGFYTLSLEKEYLISLSKLPDYHKDPFDRMLVATAAAENMTIISVDENIQKYDVPCLW